MNQRLSALLIAGLLACSAGVVWAGGTSSNDPNATTPCDSSDGGSCGCGSSGPKGMPTYSFKSMLASLTLTDAPVGYVPPVGPTAETTLTYNQREADQPAVFSTFNVGPKWTMNWLTWIQDNPTSPGSQVLRYVAGGGGRPYSGYNTTTHAFASESDNGAVLVQTSANPITYELRYANGSKDVFAESDGSTAYPRRVLLTQIIDPQGNTLTLTYDSQRRLTAVTDAIGQVTRFEYAAQDAPLLVTAITDPYGRSAKLTYDASGRLASITDVAGMTSSFTYDGGTFVTSMTTPYGTTTFAHTEGANNNASELSIQATDPDGNTERTEYLHTAPGIPFSESQVPSGMATFNAYINYRDSYYWDKKTFAEACTISNGKTTCDYTKARIKHFLHLAPSYTATARVLESVKYPLENRIWYDYPNQGGFAAGTGSFDQPTHIGRVLDDGSTQLTTLAYNAYGLVTQKIDPDGHETDYTYDPANWIDLLSVQQKTATGFDTIARYTYNSQHEPLTYTDAAGQTTIYTYNTRGQRTSMTDPLGNVTRYTYDANGRLANVVDALGHVAASFTYDAYGRVASDTDSQGYTRRYAYDALDRLTQITYPDGTARKYTWNKLDLAATTDRQGKMTQYAYDAERNPVQITDPLGRITQYGYYPNGTLHTLTDPKGNITTWNRDLESRTIAKTYADGRGDSLAYDKASRLVAMTDALGQTKRYRYDQANLLTGIGYDGAVNPTASVAYRYDPAYGRLVGMDDGLGTTTFSYVPVGALGALKLAMEDGPYNNDTIQYSYDAAGHVIKRSTDKEDAFVYDPLGRVTQETNPLGSFAYHYLGDTDQLVKRDLTTPSGRPGLSLRNAYDPNVGDRQLHQMAYDEGRSHRPTAYLEYRHSPEHLVLSRLEADEDNPVARYQRFAYDAAYRLTGVDGLGRKGDAEYGYDDADNLLHVDRRNHSFLATANALNQLATVDGTARTYDADGNLLSDGAYQYAWDAENRLIGVTNLANQHVTAFKYDGLGRRLVDDEQDSGGTLTETRTLWCGTQVCQSRDGNDGVKADHYDQGEYHAQGIAYCDRDEKRDDDHDAPANTNVALYYVRDALGSVIGVTDASGREVGVAHYDAYGMIESSHGVRPDFGYAGMLRHPETGMYLTLYRAYDPRAGRWLSRDPIGERGGLNVYTYVQGNPISFADPYGLWRLPDYIGGNINIAIPNPFTGTLVGWSGTISVDRYGDVFWSPLGAGVGKSATVVSGSLTANWLNQSCKPSQSQLSDFLSANGFNATAGYWGGISESYTPGSGTATGVGFVTPQVGASYNYSFHGGNIGFGW